MICRGIDEEGGIGLTNMLSDAEQLDRANYAACSYGKQKTPLYQQKWQALPSKSAVLWLFCIVDYSDIIYMSTIFW
ncbi:unnamed protein product [Urochloa humidicola]